MIITLYAEKGAEEAVWGEVYYYYFGLPSTLFSTLSSVDIYDFQKQSRLKIKPIIKKLNVTKGSLKAI